MSNQKNIYELELHESIQLPCGTSIMRVPGGWLYGVWDYEKEQDKSGTFVPFDNEFQKGSTPDFDEWNHL